ncbi:hypothetical protein PROFUN_14338 [Planoprotostelium fungivorum]|uniref:Homeobox domain-containing protein n=1 Tax=Planoprotostelium fungivorum TaxID=1890364 RepID=A0A2P6N0K5_9EUKA|nr:hypothetical protein PROFUN_14338 [Planoprotostelium fungivorum]
MVWVPRGALRIVPCGAVVPFSLRTSVSVTGRGTEFHTSFERSCGRALFSGYSLKFTNARTKNENLIELLLSKSKSLSMNVAQLVTEGVDNTHTTNSETDNFVFKKRKMEDCMEISSPQLEGGEPNKRRRREQVPCQQKTYLETIFQTIQYPDAHLRQQLATRFGTSSRKIQIWFQNRRTKAKTDGQKPKKPLEKEIASSPSTSNFDRDVTPLLTYIKNGNIQEVKQLLGQCEPANFINTCDPQRGYSPLHMAAFYGFEDIARLLLSFESIHINIRDNDNYTPLHLCCLYRRTNIARMLLAAGAVPNAASTEGYTPLHAAALTGDLPTLRLLLEGGANADSTDVQGFSALAFCVREGHEELVSELLGHKAFNQLRTEGGDTLLHLACRANNIKGSLVARLVHSGLRLDTKNNDNITPLALLQSAGRQDVITLLEDCDHLTSFSRASPIQRDNIS